MRMNQLRGRRLLAFCRSADATAILDRLLHHAVTLNIRGNSYRKLTRQVDSRLLEFAAVVSLGRNCRGGTPPRAS